MGQINSALFLFQNKHQNQIWPGKTLHLQDAVIQVRIALASRGGINHGNGKSPQV